MIAHTPALLPCLASGYSLDAASRISATTHRTECCIFHRTPAEAFAVKCCLRPASLLSPTWARPGHPAVPPATLLPPSGCQTAALAASCLMHLTAPSPRCPFPAVSGVSPLSSLSDTFPPLFPPRGCLYALPYSFLTASPGLFCQVFLQNKLLYKLVCLFQWRWWLRDRVLTDCPIVGERAPSSAGLCS